jgi:hypothetical protein
VEGAHGRASSKDVSERCIQIPEYVPSSNPQNAEALTPKQRIAGFITARLVSKVMTRAIDFDN